MEFHNAFRTSAYVQDKDLRIKYLRADLFDAKKSAVRMIKHLNLLYKYFGVDALRRPLSLADLSKQEKDLLRAGNNQILPSRDRSGRLVAVYQGSMAVDGVTDASRVRFGVPFLSSPMFSDRLKSVTDRAFVR
jgi:hypothetical protein